MKKFICSMMSAIVFLLSPISAYASTTTAQVYNIPQLRYITDDNENITISSYFSIGDYNLDSFSDTSSTVSTIFPANVRVDAVNNRYWNYAILPITSLSDYDNSVKVVYTFSASDGGALFDDVVGVTLDIHGLYNYLIYMTDGSWESNFILNKDYLKKATYRLGSEDGTRIESGTLNLNDFYNLPSTIGFKFDYPPTSSLPYHQIYSFRLELYFDLPQNIDNSFGRLQIRSGMYGSDAYIFGDDLLGDALAGQDDYNKNVEAELGNIQTGIDNVINSVVQMGNQAWEGAQQTVQAVTQMTEQLNSAIDQQRQDILEGLGLLGDDLDNSLNNVKTEITNIGSSITNKLESTTESITNKIESTTESITNTIETKVDQVTTAVDNVKESVTEVKNSILDLPNKIKDMLLGLIVPDAETMSSKFSEFSGLLEQKLGVIYQIPMMLFDFFDTIVNAATTPQTSLTLPAFTLPWIDGSTLTVWQPVEYNIIPEGMEILSDLIQTITSMTVVVLTFNSIKRAYERFLRS